MLIRSQLEPPTPHPPPSSQIDENQPSGETVYSLFLGYKKNCTALCYRVLAQALNEFYVVLCVCVILILALIHFHIMLAAAFNCAD